METSDSSHSGIVGGVRFRRRVGLDGAEAAKIGWRVNELRDRHPFERDSQSGFLFELLLGEDNGGVTGALLEIFSLGRFAGMDAMFWRNGKRYEDGLLLFPSKRVGLGMDEEVGLAW